MGHLLKLLNNLLKMFSEKTEVTFELKYIQYEKLKSICNVFRDKLLNKNKLPTSLISNKYKSLGR